MQKELVLKSIILIFILFGLVAGLIFLRYADLTAFVISNELSISGIKDVAVKRGESKVLNLEIRNIGEKFLNRCRIEGKGESSNLISSRDVKGLAVGQKEEYIFVLDAPENLSKSMVIELIIRCEEAFAYFDFNLILREEPVELGLISVGQTKDKFNFIYSVKEKFDKSQEINAEFWLENVDGLKVSGGSDSFGLEAGQELEKTASLDLPQDFGEYVLNLELSSGGLTTSLKEPVVIGNSAGLLGRVILVEGGGKILGIAVFVTLMVFIALYAVKRLVRRMVQEDRSGYVKVKLVERKEK